MEILGGDQHVSFGIRHHGEDPAAPIRSQASSSRPAGAASSSFFGREFTPMEGLLGVIVAASALCIGLGLWCMKKIKERAAAERSARPSKIDIDWVEAGAVSPIVRKQNGCDCGWAMAAVASVEAIHYVKTMQSISLSVQELIDCDTTNNGCKTGHSNRALRYIQQNGISSESSYPYMAGKSIVGCKDRKVVARISDVRYVDCNEDALEDAVAKQPVIVRLQYTTALQNYSGGIMDYKAFLSTKTEEGHMVLIVGHGMGADGIKYWRFKNSWGEGWGEGGFGRIRRHVADKRGVLGMFMYRGIYPVLNT